jgi:hypothetical protein
MESKMFICCRTVEHLWASGPWWQQSRWHLLHYTFSCLRQYLSIIGVVAEFIDDAFQNHCRRKFCPGHLSADFSLGHCHSREKNSPYVFFVVIFSTMCSAAIHWHCRIPFTSTTSHWKRENERMPKGLR